MKKLGKLNINLEKVMSNEDLLNLRGGWTGTCCIRCDGSAEICGPADCPTEGNGGCYEILAASYQYMGCSTLAMRCFHGAY